MNSDFRALPSALSAVRVVGAQAVGIHAVPCATGDLSVWVGTHDQNPERVWSALSEFGASLHDLSVDDLRQPNLMFQMGVVPVRTDIITSVEGLVLREYWPRRITATFAGLAISVIGLDDLIINKRSVGRTRDLADVALLEKVRKRTRT